VVALILVGWALAVLLMGALSGLRSGGSPSSRVQPAATTTTTPAAAGSGDPAAVATATATPTPTPTPAATATPRDDSGVGDSRSDDPSDDSAEP
jgi:hypothetical protein